MMLIAMLPAACAALLEGTTTISDVLALATELLTWVITSMTSILTFIQANPLILIWMIVAIVGFAVGFLLRIWHGVS